MEMNVTDDPRLADYMAAIATTASQFDLSQDDRNKSKIISIISTVVALFIIIMRLMARYRTSFGYGLDDLLIIISLVFMLANLACNLLLTYNGVGLHPPAITPQQTITIGKLTIASLTFYSTNLNFVKLSVLVMYFRFFPVRKIRLGGIAIGSISCLWNVTFIMFSLLKCTPFKRVYVPWAEGSCLDERVLFLSLFIPNIITDIVILSLPLQNVWKLHTTIWQKISLTFIFLLGSFVVLASTYRYIVFVKLRSYDVYYDLAYGLAWNMIEIGSAILSACLPTLGPILRRFIKKLGGSSKILGGSSFNLSSGSRHVNDSLSKNNILLNRSVDINYNANPKILSESTDVNAILLQDRMEKPDTFRDQE